MRIQTRAVVAAPLLLLLCAFAPPPAPTAAKPPCGLPVIATAAPVYNPLAALTNLDGERFPQGAQLLLIDHGKAQPLVSGFAATADAQVYYDGMRVLSSPVKSSPQTTGPSGKSPSPTTSSPRSPAPPLTSSAPSTCPAAA